MSTIDCLAVDKGLSPTGRHSRGRGCHSPDGGPAESDEQHRLLWFAWKKGLRVLVGAVFNGGGAGNTNVYSHSWAALS